MSSLGKSINNCATVTPSSLKVNRISFPYKYENFNGIDRNVRCHTLQSGDVPNVNMPQWSVWVKLAVNGGCLLLSFKPDNPSPKVTLMNFKVFAVKKKEEKMQIYNGQGVITFTTDYSLYQYNNKFVKSYFTREENGFLREDALSFVFELDCIVEIDGNEVQSNDLRNDFKRLLDSKHCTDVILNAGDSILKAHKAVLIARSPVFDAMFKHDMQEQKLNSITIKDIEPEVLEEMLCYMYTDNAPKLKDMAGHLLEAADKYDIPNLKIECEQSLQANISIENAAGTLILADLHKAQHLKVITLEYITANASKVMETEGWKEMRIGSNIHLVEETLRALAIKFNV